MSEKDKMLAGELYDANYDKELINDRVTNSFFLLESSFFNDFKLLYESYKKAGEHLSRTMSLVS